MPKSQRIEMRLGLQQGQHFHRKVESIKTDKLTSPCWMNTLMRWWMDLHFGTCASLPLSVLEKETTSETVSWDARNCIDIVTQHSTTFKEIGTPTRSQLTSPDMTNLGFLMHEKQTTISYADGHGGTGSSWLKDCFHHFWKMDFYFMFGCLSFCFQ